MKGRGGREGKGRGERTCNVRLEEVSRLSKWCTIFFLLMFGFLFHHLYKLL